VGGKEISPSRDRGKQTPVPRSLLKGKEKGEEKEKASFSRYQKTKEKREKFFRGANKRRP